MLAIHVALTWSCMLVALRLSGTAAQTAEAQYIDYRPGDLNMIITAPHGGSEKPSTIRDRKAGCYDAVTKTCTYLHNCTKDEVNCAVTQVQDYATYNYAEQIRANVYKLTGKYPYFIANRLHRIKLEPNRPIEAATFGEEVAVANYLYYHNMITQSKAQIDKSYKATLLVDIHAQSHAHNLTELGYGVLAQQLDANKYWLPGSTMRYAANKTGNTNAILIGNISLGHLFEQLSIPCLPSPVNPTVDGREYFDGGYTVRTHSDRLHDAVQIEFSRSIRWTDINGTLSKAATALTTFFEYALRPELKCPN